MAKIKDRKGEKINHWTFLEFTGVNKYNESTWLCRCDCGFEKIQVAGNVVSGLSKWCLTCSHGQGYKNKETIPEPVWRTIVNNCKYRGRSLEITKEYAYNLFLKQNKKCALSGIDLVFATSTKEYNNRIQTASLDRIDSSIEYTEDNVQWVHKKINIMKNQLKEDEFVNLCRLIVNHHDKTNI